MNAFNWVELLLVPLTSFVTWLLSARSRRNTAIGELQDTINLLAQKNNDLYEEVVKLRAENVSLRASIEALNGELSQLRKKLSNEA